jgi:large subunit ribosomal protein L21
MAHRRWDLSTTGNTYAIIRSGGKQYKVQAGDTVRVEKLEEKNLGDVFELSEILLVGGTAKTFIGEPTLKGAKVTVVVTQQARAPKIVVFKKKRRQGYRKMQGHRQFFTELFVQSITTPEGQTVTSPKKAHIVDPEKIAQKRAEVAEQRQVEKQKMRASGETPAPSSQALKNAKRLAPNKTAKARKPAAKKTTTAAKKTAAKKVAKK